MKKTLFTLCLVMAALFCNAQNKEQEGLVKTRGRLDSEGKVIPGVAIQDASIILKGGNSTVSEKDGEFSILLPAETYYLQNVQKQGYVLVDQDILSKQYSYSKNSLVLTMETPAQQMEDELAAERKIRRTLTRQLHEREDEIERLKEENKMTAEQYREALQKLYSDQENNEKLISEMAERYSKIDYDYLDEFYIQVSNYILNGELTKADSMLNAKGNIDEDIASLNQLKDANAKERAELTKRQKKLEKSEAMAQYQLEDIAQRCYSKYEIFKMQHQNDSALYYLEKRASLDTMNVEWICDLAGFIGNYIGNYDLALYYYNKITSEVDNKTDLATSYANIGSVYWKKGDFDNALDYDFQAKDIMEQIASNDYVKLSQIYTAIGSVYAYQGNFENAMQYHLNAKEIIENNMPQEYHTITQIYNNIGFVYEYMGEYELALEYYDKAVDIIETNDLDEVLRLSTLWMNIGGVYKAMGKYDKVLEYVNKSKEIEEKYLSPNHPELAVLYCNIGSVYTNLNKIDKALEYLNKAQKIQEMMTPDHPDMATTYNNIGFALGKDGEYDNAIKYHLKAICILEKEMPNHPNTALIYNNIAYNYEQKHEYVICMEYFHKALNILKKTLGDEHPFTIHVLQNIEYVQQKMEGDK